MGGEWEGSVSWSCGEWWLDELQWEGCGDLELVELEGAWLGVCVWREPVFFVCTSHASKGKHNDFHIMLNLCFELFFFLTFLLFLSSFAIFYFLVNL